MVNLDMGRGQQSQANTNGLLFGSRNKANAYLSEKEFVKLPEHKKLDLVKEDKTWQTEKNKVQVYITKQGEAISEDHKILFQAPRIQGENAPLIISIGVDNGKVFVSSSAIHQITHYMEGIAVDVGLEEALNILNDKLTKEIQNAAQTRGIKQPFVTVSEEYFLSCLHQNVY